MEVLLLKLTATRTVWYSMYGLLQTLKVYRCSCGSTEVKHELSVRSHGPMSNTATGGYGQGNGQEDLTYIINENGNNFIGVAIQYRVSLD